MTMQNKEYGVLVCPNCGNTSSEDGISYAYLEWRVHAVKGKVNGTVVMEGNSVHDCVGWVGEKTTATNIPDQQKDCAHFRCESCQWNWWDDCNKDFK
jgi:hypothetical protein